MLAALWKSILSGRAPDPVQPGPPAATEHASTMAGPPVSTAPTPMVLNVGGGPRSTILPEQYAGWVQHWLDIDASKGPDLLCDARLLGGLTPGRYDAIYCSHNLEHYYHHEVAQVLTGFLHVLKPTGFAQLRVPDIEHLMRLCVAGQLDLDSQVGDSVRGAIRIRDILWGLGVEIEESGRDYYAHKTGFSPKTLTKALEAAGFAEVFLTMDNPNIELGALAFKQAGPNRFKPLFEIG